MNQFGGGGVINTQPATWLPVGPHNGRVTESWDHKALHDGQIYRATSYVTLGAGSALTLMITTGADDNVHLVPTLNTNGPGLAYLYKDSIASGGSTITALNGNCNIPNGTIATVKKDPTITTVGTILEVLAVGSTGFKTAVGGTAEMSTWILKPNTSYIGQFTADSASCRTIITFTWLED